MAMTVDELNVIISAKEQGFQAELNKLSQQMHGFSKNMSEQTKKVGMSFDGLANKFKQVALALGLGAVAKKSIQDYVSLSSASLGLQSIIEAQGRSFEAAKSFLDSYTKDGLVPLTDATTAYKNLLARGYDDKQIQDVLSRLKDSSAFGRQASLSLGEAVKSAAEGLKNENSILVDNAGVTKNVAKMWEEYAAKIGKTRDSLSQAEKIQAEYNGIMAETRFQVGDAAKYAGTLGGQLAQLGAQLIKASSALGAVFAPMLSAAMPYLMSFISGVTSALNVVAEFTKVLFGGAGNQNQAAKATNNVAKAQTALGAATKKAGQAAKNSVAGFDELNQLQKNAGSSADDSAAGISPGVGGSTSADSKQEDGGISSIGKKALEIRNTVIKAFEDIKNWFQQNQPIILASLTGLAAGFAGFLVAANWGAITTAFTTLSTIATGALSAIGATLATISLPAVLIGAAIALLVGAFVYFYQTNERFRGVVDGILNKIKDAAIFLWENVLVPLGKFLVGAFIAGWNGLIEVISWLLKNVLIPFGNFMLVLWENVFVPIGNVIGGVLKIAFETLGRIAESFWKNIMVPLGKFFKDEFDPVLDTLKIVLESIWKNVFVPLGTFLSATFTPVFEALGVAITAVWDNVLKPLAEFIGDTFYNAFNLVFTTVGTLIENFKTSFHGLLTFIQGVFTGDWEKAWQGVNDVFKGVVNGLVDVFKTPLNAIIDLINNFLNYLSTIKISIPSVDIPGIGKVGGGSIGFGKIPNIPKLAKGGITTGPTLAQIGEAGAEAVIPLENGGGFVDTLANAIGNALMGAMQFSNNSGGGSKEVILQIDGTQLGRILLPKLDQEQSRIGNIAIVPI